MIIATIKEWNLKNYFEFKKLYENKFNIVLISNKDELNIQNLQKYKIKYIFFPHWSWLISKEIYENYECVLFHMTDLPYGKGGSPLQNLILNKVYDTKISALKVSKNLDEGDIYTKEDFCIKEGSAQKIFEEASKKIFFKMIPKFLQKNLEAKPQEGKSVIFKRRVKEQSDILKHEVRTLDDIYDFIRMLDAKSYPKAFLKIEDFKIEFLNVEKNKDKLIGSFEVIKDE